MCVCESDRLFPGTDRLRTSPYEFPRSLQQRNRPEAESGEAQSSSRLPISIVSDIRRHM